MTKIAIPITRCRVCKSKKLIPIISLGNQYLTNFIDSPKEKWPKGPLDLVLCDVSSGGCGLLQLKHTTPLELLYKKYWYVSGINQSMRDALVDIANKAEKLIKLSSGDIILDIGSNDSTLLRSYKTPGLCLVGFEPASNLIDKARSGVTKIINDFFNFKAFKKHFGKKKTKIITAIAMFYDLNDPIAFVEDVVKCLDKDGLFIIQMNYLPLMLKNNAFDNISHEHLEYYSLMSLENLLKRHNLEIFDVELNDVNGGSFRIYIKHQDCNAIFPFKGAAKRLRSLRVKEFQLGLDKKKIYEDFATRVNRIKTKLCNFIKKESKKGKTIYVYGASTRGNTLLQTFNLDHTLIKAAADRNPMKWGKKMIGSWIPILSEEKARAEKPDYFLILPWQFLREFEEREKSFLNSGGKFIVPLPKFKVIGK